MSITSEADWRGRRDVGHVVHLTLEGLAAATKPGVSARALDAIAARIFAAHGAQSAPAPTDAFPGTVPISVNNEIVHGIPGDRRRAAGACQDGSLAAHHEHTLVITAGEPVLLTAA